MKERLEAVLRPGETAEDLVLLLRGGVHDEGIARLQEQAAELNRRFSLEEGDCYGISVFAATEESEAWILARNMRVRRRYYRVRYEDVADLRVLPTFRAPHWTVLFDRPDGPSYQKFLNALGDLRENLIGDNDQEGAPDDNAEHRRARRLPGRPRVRLRQRGPDRLLVDVAGQGT